MDDFTDGIFVLTVIVFASVVSFFVGHSIATGTANRNMCVASSKCEQGKPVWADGQCLCVMGEIK